ncbi:MAG: hypothetical protein GXO08_05110 [Aquificae bacterium]|nr:hypothetical protein [Aquificota bacterium]
MKFPKPEPEEPRFVLVPLVDVLLAVFLFLAVLAFTTPPVSVFVRLPEGSGPQLPQTVLNLTLTAEGKLFVGRREVSLDELKKLLKEKEVSAVNLFADARTPYERVAKVLSTLQEAGIRAVNLALKKAR